VTGGGKSSAEQQWRAAAAASRAGVGVGFYKRWRSCLGGQDRILGCTAKDDAHVISQKIRRTARQGGPAGITTAAATRVSGEGGEDKARGKPGARGGFGRPT
jgi:hypothetical protein